MPSTAGPWTVENVLRLFAVNGAAGTALVAAHHMAPARATVDAQLVAVNVAVAALVLSGLANVAWLLRARRAVGIRVDRLLAAEASRSVVPAHGGPPTSDPAADPMLKAGEGLIRFHREDCLLAVGRAWAPAARVVHEEAGRQPCGVCRP